MALCYHKTVCICCLFLSHSRMERVVRESHAWTHFGNFLLCHVQFLGIKLDENHTIRRKRKGRMSHYKNGDILGLFRFRSLLCSARLSYICIYVFLAGGKLRYL